MQVVLVYLQPFSRNLLLECALTKKMRKNVAKPLFVDSKSFEVIDVNKFKKPVINA